MGESDAKRRKTEPPGLLGAIGKMFDARLEPLRRDLAHVALQQQPTPVMTPAAAGKEALEGLRESRRGSNAISHLKRDPAGTAVLTESIARTTSEKEVMEALFPKLRASLEKQPGSEKLVIGDSQERQWLPQRGGEKKYDLKPDGFVIHHALFQPAQQPRHDLEGRPALDPPALACIRCVIEGKAENRATNNETLGEARMYADAIFKTAKSYCRSDDVARAVTRLHVLLVDGEKFRATIWFKGELVCCVDGDLTCEGSSDFIGRFLLGPGAASESDADGTIALLPQPTVNPIEFLVSSALAQSPLQGYELNAKQPVLGRGATGIVLRMTRKAVNQDCAVKLIESRLAGYASNEIQVLRQLRHSEATDCTSTLVDTFTWTKDEFSGGGARAIVTTPVGEPLLRKSGTPYIPATDHHGEFELNLKRLTAMIETIDKVQVVGGVAHNDARIENFVLVNDKFYLIDYSHARRVQSHTDPLDNVDVDVYGIDFARLFVSIKNKSAAAAEVAWSALLDESGMSDLKKAISRHVTGRSASHRTAAGRLAESFLAL